MSAQIQAQDSREAEPASHRSLLERKRRLLPDRHGDPMESMGNLFDVAVLIGVGFLIVALSGFGLQELISAEDITIVKNPGTSEMELIQKQGRDIQRLRTTDEAAEGLGTAIGTVYRLEDGRVVWVPGQSE
jgi:hypothetical protein